ncbi:MAG: metal-dependent hydrolase [Vicinamibacterales bacterium]
MDNVCHTLVGIAAAGAGLSTRTRLATATLAISANLPDLDVLVFATGVPSVAFRRGWTHGVVAQLLLPVAFAGAMWLWARRKRTRVFTSAADAVPNSFGWLLALSLIGIYSHVFLDYLNTYGVRLLMPLSAHWFYGDAVFIVDVWLWSMLGIGAWRARNGNRRPARIGLAAASLYVVVMLLSAGSARAIVAGEWASVTGNPAVGLMVGPVPLDPLRKDIIVDAGNHYVTGSFNWIPLRVVFDASQIPKNDRHPAVAEARNDPKVRGILVWSRFPFWTVKTADGATRVTLRDVRFAGMDRGGFSATTTVPEQD